MKHLLHTLAAAATLAGCASLTPQASSEDTAAANEPLLCKGAQQCADYWRRAQVWIATNSSYRIQVATDSVISTFGPLKSDMRFAYQVTREPISDGEERISIAMGCGNMFGCRENRDTVTAAFKAFVRAQPR